MTFVKKWNPCAVGFYFLAVGRKRLPVWARYVFIAIGLIVSFAFRHEGTFALISEFGHCNSTLNEDDTFGGVSPVHRVDRAFIVHPVKRVICHVCVDSFTSDLLPKCVVMTYSHFEDKIKILRTKWISKIKVTRFSC